MNRVIVVLLAASAMTLTGRAAATVKTTAALAEATRKVYVSATDAKGAPVTDLTAADITVKEGGKEWPVVSLEPASAPMQVAIVVDDGGTGAFQPALGQFIQKTFGHAQFSISLLNPQAMRLVDFTNDADALRTALGRLGQRGRIQVDGDQMADAISDAAKTLQQRKAERPVILALTIAGGAPHSVDPKNVLNTLRLSGASLNVVFVTGADLGMVMGDGPKQSGGRIEQAGSGPAIAPAAVKIADALEHQFLLTYTLPDGVKMSDRIAVSTSRKGIALTSPSRIADK
jgi:hypothetical protein